MGIRIVQVDAFTNRPFAGNPAAVCVLGEPRPDQWMRDVAREMNLSETAFLTPQNGGYNLRWLTPAVEVDLCGHATVASAHVLWQDGHLPEGRQARFHTRSGLLLADRRGDWIELDFPAKASVAAAAPEGMLKALGVEHARYVGKNAWDYLVEVDSEETLRGLSPDHSTLRKIPVRGIIVTSRAVGRRVRFRLALLRARVGHRRRPRDGIGAYGARAVLVAETGEDGAHRPTRPRRAAAW